MAVNDSTGADAALAAWWQAPAEWFGVLTQNLWALQTAQLETMSAWQQAVAASQQEWWDDWAARWAGGAPID